MHITKGVLNGLTRAFPAKSAALGELYSYPLETLNSVSLCLCLLQFMLLDPVSRSLAAAPVEQEPVPPEEAAALDEARAALDRGERISHEDILREFGLPPR